MQTFQNKTKDVPQLPTILHIAEGLTYDITIDIDTEDGLIIGASCKLIKVDITDIANPSPSGILWVEFTDKTTGHLLRNKTKHLYKPTYSNTWTPIEPVFKTILSRI